jgi:thioredoxin reductase
VARATICATGVEYRRLGLPNEVQFLGAGMYYGAGVFVCIGGDPRTGWADEVGIVRDSAGYLVTGPDLMRDSRLVVRWPLEREPYYLETNVPGVFAAAMCAMVRSNAAPPLSANGPWRWRLCIATRRAANAAQRVLGRSSRALKRDSAASFS